MAIFTIKVSSDGSSDIPTIIAKGIIALMRTFNAKPKLYVTPPTTASDAQANLWTETPYDDSAMARMGASSKLMSTISSLASNAGTMIRVVIIK
jgi:hypothetical protein